MPWIEAHNARAVRNKVARSASGMTTDNGRSSRANGAFAAAAYQAGGATPVGRLCSLSILHKLGRLCANVAVHVVGKLPVEVLKNANLNPKENFVQIVVHVVESAGRVAYGSPDFTGGELGNAALLDDRLSRIKNELSKLIRLVL
jgi:hypothetical protein